MSGRRTALVTDNDSASGGASSPLSGDSNDTLNKMNENGNANAEIAVPETRDGFFDYRDEKTLRSVCCKSVFFGAVPD